MEAAVETVQLTKHYGPVVAVSGLDLRIEAGEIFGFLGANGAGKSTTIKVLLDEIRPSSGSARIFGMDSHTDMVEIHRRIGYLPGELRVPGELTGNEYLDFLARLRSLTDRTRRDELVERFEFDPTRRLGQLSTGNKQKVGLVQAFMHRPDLVLLDEPTTGLDPLVQHDFHEMLREEATEGTTVFLSSHMLSEVGQVADRVGVLRRGELVTVDRIDALKARARIQVELDFQVEAPRSALADAPGVLSVTGVGPTALVTLEGDIDPVLRAAVAAGHVVAVRTPELDLERIFLGFYRDADADAADDRTDQPATDRHPTDQRKGASR